MSPIPADLRKLRILVEENHWRIDSVNIQFRSCQSDPKEFCPRTTVHLAKPGLELVLQSDDDDFFNFCSGLRQSFDDTGAPMFRRIADLNRYYRELKDLTTDEERKRGEAVQRYASGHSPLKFAPEPLVAEFLRSRDWGDPRYLSLKTEYFDVLAAILLSSRKALRAQEQLHKKFPTSKVYEERIDRLLGQAFGIGEQPVQGYLRYAQVGEIDLGEVASKLVAEARRTNDLFQMLAGRGGIPGDIGLPYLIDVYRRYAEWTRSLLVPLSNAVCLIEGKPLPDPQTGMSKRAEIIRRSAFSEVVDCFDPRIRHAASHNAISYDHDRGMVNFSDLDGTGTSLGMFALTYVEVSDKTRSFIDGLVPGLLLAFGMRQQVQLLLTILSGEYLRLLLLIDNEAT